MSVSVGRSRPVPSAPPGVAELPVEPGVLRVWVPGALRNLMNATRMHWRVRQSYELAWRSKVSYLVGWQMKAQDWTAPPEAPKRIAMSAYVSTLFDHNPLHSGLNVALKPVVDGLLPERLVRRRTGPYLERGCGLIHSDAPNCGHEFLPPTQVAARPRKQDPKAKSKFSPKVDPRGVLIVVRLKEGS